MLKRVWLGLLVVFALTGVLRAQSGDVVFVQIEAKRSVAEARAAAAEYAADLPDVNGFAIGRGWFGIALGPYERVDADQVLQVYKREGVIPSDSYIALPSSYREQFWPIGANVLGRGALPVPAPQTPAVQVPDAPVAQLPAPEGSPALPQVQDALPDETPAQARASERALSGPEREELQVALKWAGTYRGLIDGAFGRGTRAAMAAWQGQNGFDETGILTTRQRAVLLGQYNAILDGLDLQEVVQDAAGIAIQLPLGVAPFERAVSPFVQYGADDADQRVLLISQPGDQASLFGLFDILQTLEIVPQDGPRSRDDTSFRIKGENDRIVTEIEARLEGSEIKGFALIWPAGDEDRRTRLLAEMRKSFRRVPGVLPLDAGLDAVQDIDLVSGLEIRKPRLSRSGFFVDGNGTVITTSQAVGACTRVTLDEETEAQVVADDGAVAVLRPSGPLAPLAFARFGARVPRLGSEVAVAGYSFQGTLGAPSITFGTLSDIKGLRGEPGLKRLALAALPGDAGGPVLDAGGGLLGMLLPRADGARNLPDEVNFAAASDAIRALLDGLGVNVLETETGAPIDPVDLTVSAQGMTVLVSCWD